MAEDVVAVSSTAIEQAPARDYESFEAEALARDSGQPQILPTPAAPAAATPVDQAASTDAIAKPASESGKPKEKGAKARSAELDPEIAELREKLRVRALLREELARGDVKPAESSPAPKATSEDIERYESMPGWPKDTDYEDYGRLTAARTRFILKDELKAEREQQRQEQEAKNFQGAQANFDAKGVEAFPDFREVLTEAAQSGLTLPKYVVDEILPHEQGHAITYQLVKAIKDDPALVARLNRSQLSAGMVIGEILARSKPVSPQPIARISKAPEPPVTLGTRPHDKGDPMRAANANGDYPSFEAAFIASGGLR